MNRLIPAIIVLILFSGCEGSPENSLPPLEPIRLPDTPLKSPEKTKQKAKKLPTIPGALPAPPSVEAPPEDAEKSKSGLAWLVLEKGRRGKKVGPYDTVTVDYTGWTTDGRMFDSSVVKGKQQQLKMYSDIIDGWVEGLQLMTKGEKRRFWIPEDLAYKGDARSPQGMLVFDIELIKIDRAPPMPPVPDNVSGPPPGAEKSKSGISWIVLKQGRGSNRPRPNSEVSVEFTGWTTEGKLFRSTLLDGRPAKMPLDRISSRGLAEAIQLMTKGEQRRFWIPADLAYKGSAFGGPQGDVVMDVKLLLIYR